MARINATLATERRARVHSLHQSGMEVTAIAQTLSLPTSSVRRYLKDAPPIDRTPYIKRACALKQADPNLTINRILEIMAEEDGIDSTSLPLSRSTLSREFKTNGLTTGSVGLDRLLNDVIWPKGNIISLTGDEARNRYPSPVRRVSTDSRGQTGSYHSSKVGRSIFYESGYEKTFLHYLERSARVLWYCEQPCWIDRYVPDVFVLLNDGRAFVAEVKHEREFVYATHLATWRNARQWCASHGYGFLVTSKSRSIQDVQRHEAPATLIQALLTTLHTGPLTWSRFQDLCARYRTHWLDEYAVVLQRRLVWDRNPFQLSLPPSERS